MSKILLPRGYLSWTAINMWKTSKPRYIRHYILGEDVNFTNSGIEYGKKVSEALETGEYGDDELIKTLGSLLPRYSKPEHEFTVEMDTQYGKIPLLGKLDSFEPKTTSFREYKTSRNKWTQAMAEKHKQLHHYATMLWLENRKLPPEVHLDWIQTEEVDGEVRLTGKIESFHVKITMADVLKYMAMATQVAREIDVEYRQQLKNLA